MGACQVSLSLSLCLLRPAVRAAAGDPAVSPDVCVLPVSSPPMGPLKAGQARTGKRDWIKGMHQEVKTRGRRCAMTAAATANLPSGSQATAARSSTCVVPVQRTSVCPLPPPSFVQRMASMCDTGGSYAPETVTQSDPADGRRVLVHCMLSVTGTGCLLTMRTMDRWLIVGSWTNVRVRGPYADNRAGWVDFVATPLGSWTCRSSHPDEYFFGPTLCFFLLRLQLVSYTMGL